MLRIYSSKMEILTNCAVEKRNKFPCFLCGPGKAYGQDLLVIKSKTLSPLNGRQTAINSIPFHFPIPCLHLIWEHQLRSVFFEFSQRVFYTRSEFYHLRNVICHGVVPQISTDWKLTLELLFPRPRGKTKKWI